MSRIPKFVLVAGMDAIHTYRDWMNSEADDEGDRMDAHRDALGRLCDALYRDIAVAPLLRDDEIADFLGEGATR